MNAMCTNQGCKSLVPYDKGNTTFFYYQLKAAVQELVSMGSGSTYMELARDKLQCLEIVVPPSSERESISNFLDQETAKIDALVAKKERLIELLREKRIALITRAVSKGLDPTATMKDSGFPWLGEVPEHWQVIKLNRVTVARCDGPFGSSLKSENYVEDGVRVVRLQNIRFAHFDSADRAFIDSEYSKKLGDHSVRANDLVVAGLGDESNPVGRAGVAPSAIEPAIVKADCFRFRLDTERATPSYLAMQLSAAAVALGGAFATGSTRARMNLTDTSERPIVLPPLDEQRAIVAFIDKETTTIDELNSKIKEGIKTLIEYRGALISAAVTGKIDVRKEVA